MPGVSDSQTTKGQRARILRRLLESMGTEVAAYELAQIALQYGARVHELRALGFVIQNRSEMVGRQRRSWFRLAMTPVSTRGITYAQCHKPISSVICRRNIWILVEESGAPDKSRRLWLGVVRVEVRSESRKPEIERHSTSALSVLAQDVKRL
jgi:hypothetical protein